MTYRVVLKNDTKKQIKNRKKSAKYTKKRLPYKKQYGIININRGIEKCNIVKIYNLIKEETEC